MISPKVTTVAMGLSSTRTRAVGICYTALIVSDSIPSPTAESSRPCPCRRYLWLALWLAAVPLLLLVDRPLYEAYSRWPGPIVPLDWFAQFLTYAVTLKWIGLGALLLVALDRRLRWWFLGDLALVMIAQSSAVEVLKRLFGRVRPETALHATLFRGPDFSHSNYCFPSGHAAASFALAALLSLWYPRWRWAFVAAAVLVCLARLQLQRHFASDVVFGAWVGWVLAVSLVTARQRWAQRRAARATSNG